MLINDEIYIQTVDKLIAQGGCSVECNGDCKYNGPNGRHCFAGHLVPDTLKSSMREGSAQIMLDCLLLEYSREELEMIEHGQRIHDSIAMYSDEAIDLLKEWRGLLDEYSPKQVNICCGRFVISD